MSNMVSFLQRFFAQQGRVVLDGALATELEQRGADLRDPLWSAKLLIEAPELIRQLHYDYFVAGADVAITASYQATIPGFVARGMDTAEAVRLMRLSVELACEARDRFWRDAANRANRLRPLVAASIGPYGAYLADGSEYRGDYGLSVDELVQFHHERMGMLAETDADLLACETIPALIEGVALVESLRAFPDVQAWLSFSCCDARHVCHGEPFAECAALADMSDQIVAVGVNCTPPQFVESLLASAQGVTTKPLLAYPNRGETWDADRGCWQEGGSMVDFGAAAVRWSQQGARLIGGCCRSGPEDISAIRRALVSPR